MNGILQKPLVKLIYWGTLHIIVYLFIPVNYIPTHHFPVNEPQCFNPGVPNSWSTDQYHSTHRYQSTACWEPVCANGMWVHETSFAYVRDLVCMHKTIPNAHAHTLPAVFGARKVGATALIQCFSTSTALGCLDSNSHNCPASMLTEELWELKSRHLNLPEIEKHYSNQYYWLETITYQSIIILRLEF